VIRLQNTGSIRVTGSTRVTGHWRPGRVGSRVNVTDPVPSLMCSLVSISRSTFGNLSILLVHIFSSPSFQFCAP